MSDTREFPIHFEPAQRMVRARSGESILAAAQRSGIHIDSSCGGAGSCLQCRVSIISHSPRVAESSEHNLRGAGGFPLTPLADPRTPSGEEQGRHRCYLACSVEATGPLHVRVEPRGGLGARNHRPSIVGQCAIPEVWDPRAWKGPSIIDIRVPCAARAGYVPALTLRMLDFTILDSRLESVPYEGILLPEQQRPAIEITGDGMDPVTIFERSILVPPGTNSTNYFDGAPGYPLQSPPAWHGLMLRGAYYAKRKLGTLYLSVGPMTFLTFTYPHAHPSHTCSATQMLPSTPMLAGQGPGTRPRLMPAIPGAVIGVEFSPMTPRALLTTSGDIEPLGMSASGLWEFLGEAIRTGIMKPDGTFNPSRTLRDGPEGPEFVLSSPDVAAMTPTGKVWNTVSTITVSEKCSKAFMAELAKVVNAAKFLVKASEQAYREIVLVIAGSHGFHPSRTSIENLPLASRLSETLTRYDMSEETIDISPEHLGLADPQNIRIESVGDALSLGAALTAVETFANCPP